MEQYLLVQVFAIEHKSLVFEIDTKAPIGCQCGRLNFGHWCLLTCLNIHVRNVEALRLHGKGKVTKQNESKVLFGYIMLVTGVK